MYRRALQICTISCIFIAVDTQLMLAVNVEEFRYLANKFLSKDLAEKLTNLVSQASKTKKIAFRKETDNEPTEIFNDSKLRNEEIYNQRQTKHVRLNNKRNKRFQTVNNSYNKQLSSNLDNVSTETGPVFLRDDLDGLLNEINGEYSNGYNTTDTLTKSDVLRDVTRSIRQYTNSREPTGETAHIDKKIDYTETKLGEWRYNHVETEKPVVIKNLKTGNLERNRNYQGVSAHGGVNRAPDVHKLLYLGETRLGHQGNFLKADIFNNLKRGLLILGIKNKYSDEVKGNDQEVDKEDIFMETKQDIGPERKPQKHLLQPILKTPEINDEEALRFETTTSNGHQAYDGRKPKSKQQGMKNIEDYDATNNGEEYGISNKYIMESKKKPKHNMREQYATSSQMKPNDNREDKKSLEVSEGKESNETRIHNEDNENKDKDEVNDSRNNEETLIRNKERYLDFKGSKISEKNQEKGLSIGVSVDRLPHSDEGNLKTDKLNSQQNLEHSKEVKSKNSNKKLIKPIEENDRYEKFALGTKNKKSNIRKGKKQSGNDNKYKKSPERDITAFDKDYRSDNIKFKDLNYCKRHPNSDKCKGKNIEPKIASRELAETQPDSKVKLGPKGTKDRILTNFMEVKDQPGNEHYIGSKPKKKKSQKRKPIEENEFYDKYELGRERNEDDRREKRPKNDGDVDIKKKKLQNPIEDHDLYQKFALGSEKKKNNKRTTKQESDESYFNYNKTIKENINTFDKDYESNNISQEQILIQSTTWQTNSKDSNYCKKYPNSDKCKKKETKITSKESGEFSKKKYKGKIELNEEKERFPSRSAKTKDHRVTVHDIFELRSTKQSNKLRTQKQKEKQHFEEKHSRETKNVAGKDEKEDSRDVTIKSDKIKHNYHDSYKDDSNKENETRDNDKVIHKYKEYREDSRDVTIKSDKIKHNYHDSYKDDSNKENETRDKDKVTHKYKEYKNDKLTDADNVFKAVTGSLLDDSAQKDNEPTKKFTMKGTIVPKRDFYKLSSPNYYKDLPRVVEKYDFNEPIPERDRERDKIDNSKIAPARINQKVRLTIYDDF